MTSGRTFSNGSLERAGFIFFMVIAVIPMALSLLYALAYTVGLAGLLSDGFTLAYWRKLGQSTEIAGSFAMSGMVAIAAMALNIAVALPLGIYLRGLLRRGPLSYMIYLPLGLPGAVLGFLTFHILSGAGMLSRLAAALGVVSDPTGFPSLVNDQHGIGIVLAEIAVGIPFFTILFAGLHEAERVEELEQLAATLGATRRQSLLRIALPLLLERAFPTIVLSLVSVLGAYEIPLLLGTQSPQMISVLTMRKYAMFDLGEKPEAFICAILYTLVSSALIVIAYRRVRREPW